MSSPTSSTARLSAARVPEASVSIAPVDLTRAPAASSDAVATSVGLSAQGLHELAVQAFRTGNRGRLSLCEALRVLSETRLYYELGFPSLPAYADVFFQLRRSETFEYVRVSTALVDLTELREAFGRGAIGWSMVKGITRVESVDSQNSWIDFARRNGVERTLAEARDALRDRRDTPRDGSFGLPNLDQKLVLRFPRSDMEKVRKWLEAASATIAENTGSEGVSLEQAVLFLCEQGMTAGLLIANQVQIVFQSCPDCGRARVATRDGFVEVATDEVARYEGCAEPVVIDGPTPPRLRRQVLAREAGRCGNPRCRNLADHCHHIISRSRGGKTDLANEVAVCATCHALVHAGLLRVSGRAVGDLCWSPVVGNDSVGRDAASARKSADRLPVLRLVPTFPRTGPSSPPKTGVSSETPSSGSREECSGDRKRSAIADSDYETVNRDDLVAGLKRLGVSAARSRQLIEAAIAGLPRGEISEEAVLRNAIRAI